MINKQLQNYLSQFPDEMPIMLLSELTREKHHLTEEDILHTSDTAHIDSSYPEDEWDTEDGKMVLGAGRQYLLFNPIIL